MTARSVRASAPVRVDLAGGTLDLWPLSVLLTRAVTVNVALSLRAGCEITVGGDGFVLEAAGAEPVRLARLGARPERDVPGRVQLAAVVAAHLGLPPCRIRTWSDAPPGSGLGGSSALVMALLKAASHLAGREMTDAEAVGLACNLETRVLKLPAGSQDHWAAWCGGASVLEYGPEGARRTATDGALGLVEELVVADTGVSHHSGMNNWAVLRAALEGDAGVLANLEEIGAAAGDMAEAMLAGGSAAELLRRAGEAMRREWEARRRLAPAVSSPEVEAVIAAAASVDAAAKVCGAGGGGCVACLPARPGGSPELRGVLERAGFRVLPATGSAQGAVLDLSS